MVSWCRSAIGSEVGVEVGEFEGGEVGVLRRNLPCHWGCQLIVDKGGSLEVVGSKENVWQ